MLKGFLCDNLFTDVFTWEICSFIPDAILECFRSSMWSLACAAVILAL